MCGVLKNLYSLKQSGQLWNKNVIAFFISLDFIQINRDLSILICHVLDGETTMVNIYIDNFLFALICFSTLDILKETFGQKYSIKN